MKEEIVGGLKNALERGDSLEHAMLTMINAGYNREEVLAAAKILPISKLAKYREVSDRAEIVIQKNAQSARTKTILIILIIIMLVIILSSVSIYVFYKFIK